MRNGKHSYLILMISLGLIWMMMAQAAQAKDGAYCVHFSSFKTDGQAQNDARRLTTLGYDAFVREVDLEGRGKWYRVYAGRYASAETAYAAATRLKSKGQIDQIFIHLLTGEKIALVKAIQPKGTKTAALSKPVVGNKRSKRYHLPDMPYYNRVYRQNRILFATEKEAIDNGYYKAGTGKDLEDGAELKAQPPQATKPAPLAANQARSVKPVTIKDKAAQSEELASLILGEKKLLPPPPPLKDIEKDRFEDFREPDEKDIVEPESDSELYAKALAEFKNKDYEQALATFKEFISREDTPKEWGQRALRHMADCHYWLGREEGDKQQLLIASEFYKNTLASFPDPNEDNALTYYRLAKTYENLKYYPEAIKHYNSLIEKYPQSSLIPEAYWRIAEIYYTDGKFSEAAEGYIRYLLKYRGIAHTKRAYYLVAHSFYKAKQSTNAEIWFRDIIKRWPDLTHMPKNIVLDYARHKMDMLRFTDATDAFSFYANVYPDDPQIQEITMMLAEAYAKAGQVAAALGIYSKMLATYPEGPQAALCMLAMAKLGVEAPGVNVFREASGIEYYRNPLDTYDELIMRDATADIAEEAMLHKGIALAKKGQKRKAAEVFLEFLNLYPESKRIASVSRALKSASSDLIDEYFAKNDHLAVAYVYFRSFSALEMEEDEYPEVRKIAESLKALNLIDDYVGVLSKYLRVVKDETTRNRGMLNLAEGLILQGKEDEAEKMLLALMNRPSARQSGLMPGIQKNLAEVAYRRKQYGQAVSNYSAAVQAGQEMPDPGTLYLHYARSLEKQREDDQALQKYLTAVKYLDSQKNLKATAGIVYKEIGDLYVKGNNLGLGLNMYAKALESASDEDMKLWSRFLVGQTYLKLDREDQAQTYFTQIKTQAGPEGFWSNVVDFYLSDIQWWQKYGSVVQK